MIKGRIKKIIGNKNYQYLINLKIKKNSLVHFGNDHECPVCNSKIGKFVPGGIDVDVIKNLNIIGAGRFENQMCPVCKAFNRDRLLALFLKRKTDIYENNVKLLHVAPEKGIQLGLRKTKNIDYISADLDSELADIKMDITDIQYPDNSFDVVICNHVLEHIPEDRKAMSEIARILRPDGWAILQVPISYLIEKTIEDFSIVDPKEREIRFGQNDHVRVYASDYMERLIESGLDISLISTSEYLEDQEIIRFGVIKEENIFFCTKKK